MKIKENQGKPKNLGSESTHLDLEKLFLLSDSLENLSFHCKIAISEPKHFEQISGEPGFSLCFVGFPGFFMAFPTFSLRF